MPEDKRSTLLDVCRTRWLQRIDGLLRVQEMIVPILNTLDLISNNHDGSYGREARSDAQGVFWTTRYIIHTSVNIRVVTGEVRYCQSL